MPLAIIRFLYPRGPRLAASKEEANALKYIENQFVTLGLEAENTAFPSFSGSEWYYAFAYATFPVATVLFILDIGLAIALVALGLVLLRLDMVIWPFLNNMFALGSRSHLVTGRVAPLRDKRLTVVVIANADNRRVLWPLAKWPFLEHATPFVMSVVDLMRLLHGIFYVSAWGLDFFSMREQVQLLWRFSWYSGVLSLLACCFYLAQVMHGRLVNCANDNLSGLQVLVDVAGDFAYRPCQRSELVFAAVGAGRAGMLGTRRLLRMLKLKEESSYVLNLTSLGSGKLAIAKSEGYTRPIHVYDDLAEVGFFVGSISRQSVEVAYTRQRRGDFAMARSMGYRALTVVGLNERGHRGVYYDQDQIDEANLEFAREYVQQLIMRLDDQA